MIASLAKTGERIKMPFRGGADSRGPRNCVLDGVRGGDAALSNYFDHLLILVALKQPGRRSNVH